MKIAARGPPLSIRILCVDDNYDLADSEVTLLRMVGFDARACYSGHSALEMAATFSPHICLIDLHMPGMNGDELAVKLLLEAGDRPIFLVAITAMSNEASANRIKNAGFSLHLVKPVEPSHLIDVMNGFFKKPLTNPL